MDRCQCFSIFSPINVILLKNKQFIHKQEQAVALRLNKAWNL
jgi:hypothetical protein